MDKAEIQNNINWKYGELENLIKEMSEYYKWFYSLPDLRFLSTSDKKDPNTIIKEYVDSIISDCKNKIIEKSTFEPGSESNGWYEIYKDDLDSIL